MEELRLNPSRVRAFRPFILTLATEFRDRLDGCESQTQAMQRRRTQCHWLLDRTSLSAALYIIFEHRNEPELMLFLLVCLTYGFTTWRNTMVAGGLEYLKTMYATFDAEDMTKNGSAHLSSKKLITHKQV